MRPRPDSTPEDRAAARGRRACDAPWTIGELSERAGVSVDTIRYYQRLRLVTPGTKRGRARFYGLLQLDQLAQVKRLQRHHLSLQAIARVVRGHGVEVSSAAGTGALLGATSLAVIGGATSPAPVPTPILRRLQRAGLLPSEAPPPTTAQPTGSQAPGATGEVPERRRGGDRARVIDAVGRLLAAGWPPDAVVEAARCCHDRGVSLAGDLGRVAAGTGLRRAWSAVEREALGDLTAAALERSLAVVSEAGRPSGASRGGVAGAARGGATSALRRGRSGGRSTRPASGGHRGPPRRPAPS